MKQNIEELLETGSIIRIKPRGYSMYPVIVPGRDEAMIQKADTSALRRGDVVLYRRDNGILVLHRIYKVSSEGFYMVGDNQTAVEGPLPAERIRGKMLALIRNGKEIEVEAVPYRCLCGIWLLLRPVRRPVSLTAAAIKRFMYQIAGKNQYRK